MQTLGPCLLYAENKGEDSKKHLTTAWRINSIHSEGMAVCSVPVSLKSLNVVGKQSTGGKESLARESTVYIINK